MIASRDAVSHLDHQQTISSALKQAELRFDGEPALVRRMPQVLDLTSPDQLGVDKSSRWPVWFA